MSLNCPFCEADALTTVTYTHAVKAGRRTVQVPGCLQMVCGHCGEAVVPLSLYDLNHKRIEAALAQTPAAVSRGLLKRLRETYDLSQREASRLFGAGEAAFAKWESGQSDMSDPAALLVQCALEVPGVVEHLAKLAGVPLQPQGAQRAAQRRVGRSASLNGADAEPAHAASQTQSKRRAVLQ
ncbi:type II TA system antitoxin MqsA family protein [Roseateles depolymerans]|uniref:Uncharacterized protein n=1 Tax=Roseateles depolymerans TaxID=76731 RepID=A0A0U3MV63_9BURK|nr:type II TA system antitoxin MqsA family protein [Roseateles depolymerans]ALV08250.1 hypothetical protein RD2015_3799 [Roseateles depolymerans]REG21525.1 putative zinc finger/helix-turn-helix YgiT family protein [Roseateles depolymerans]